MTKYIFFSNKTCYHLVTNFEESRAAACTLTFSHSFDKAGKAFNPERKTNLRNNTHTQKKCHINILFPSLAEISRHLFHITTKHPYLQIKSDYIPSSKDLDEFKNLLTRQSEDKMNPREQRKRMKCHLLPSQTRLQGSAEIVMVSDV